MTVLYQDPYVTLEDNQLTVKHYYFVGVSKTVYYTSIKRVYEKTCNVALERFRLWGFGLDGQWMHWDMGRPLKDRCIVIDTGSRIKVGITPQDHDAVLKILEEKAHLTR